MTTPHTPEAVSRAKDAIRQQVWDSLEQAGVVAPGVHGYIPDFTGADHAARRLTALPVWTAARVIMAAPDRAQLPVRAAALTEGKLVIMAVPKLAADPPFVLLDPARLTVPPEHAATHQVATRIGKPIPLDRMPPIDLVICGSVAVNLTGARLGKGGGFFDREIALLRRRADMLGPAVTIATTVHQFQVLDQPLPVQDHDVHVTLITTPEQTYTCTRTTTTGR